MMLEPSVDNLLKKVNSKYALVTISAKRAREMYEKENEMIDHPKSNKLVGIALEEILDEKLTVDYED